MADNIFLEFYKTTLDYRTKVISIIFASGFAIAIPNLVTFLNDRSKAEIDKQKAAIDKERVEQEVKLKEIELAITKSSKYQDYTAKFIELAASQDIELRLRFAEYFAFVAEEKDRTQWALYNYELRKRRDDIRNTIDTLRNDLAKELGNKDPDQVRIALLERHLRWTEAGLGPVAANESVTIARPRPEGDSPGVEREFRTPVPQALIDDLTKKATDAGALRWMQHAIPELGVREIPGPDNNIRIMEYARFVQLQWPRFSDEIPWAGLFVNFVLKKAGFDKFPPDPLRNRAWEKWGVAIDQPKFGALAVFWRTSPDSGTGHVGFVVGDHEQSLTVLGGNQNDSVSIVELPRSQLVALRMPPANP